MVSWGTTPLAARFLLQHPHILGLIDSGETEHQLWYVMPIVEGESLRDRITREKQLPAGGALWFHRGCPGP